MTSLPSDSVLYRRWIFLVPIGIVLALLSLVMLFRSGPARHALEETAVPVRVVPVLQDTVIPHSLGFGTVAPGTEWKGIAEVSGRVTYRHPDLNPGSLLAADTEIIRIDPVDYQLEVTRLEANIRSTEAALQELEQSEANTKQSLAIEQRALELSERDLGRQRELLERGTASQAAVDNQERSVLSQRQNVQTLRNELNLIPSKRDVRQAELDLARVQLAEARRDVERTVITLPLDARIQAVAVEPDQVVTNGQTMVEADGLASAEVTAQFSIAQLLPIFGAVRDVALSSLFGTGEGRTPLLGDLGLSATVTLSAGEQDVQWEARVIRLSESIDPQTRTAGVVVAVNDPYGEARGGSRPPLSRNMYVSVELRGTPIKNALVVPASAVHQNKIYVVTEDNRLEIRPIEVQFAQADIVVLKSGVSPDEYVVVSDLIPAVPGMALAPSVDEVRSSEMRQAMSKGAPVR